jgi:ribonuclease HII
VSENDKKIICGIDEAGRGPLAGPVTASAVILSSSFPVFMLRDSKALKEQRRSEIAQIIRKEALDYTVGWCWPHEIDKINIHNATLLAMSRAILQLKIKPDLILIDGKFTPNVPFLCEAIVKGDTKIPEIMAASIIAKTTRDLWMVRYSRIENNYNFEKHKGYPTQQHRDKIKIFGLSIIHRKSFNIKF